MKKCNICNTGVTIFVVKGPYPRRSNSLLRWYSQFGNLPLPFALFRSHIIYLNYQKF